VEGDVVVSEGDLFRIVEKELPFGGEITAPGEPRPRLVAEARASSQK
jgi:hypothetical protein